MAVRFPTPDEITQKLIDAIIGPGKKIEDLENQWVVKHIILGQRDITIDQIEAARAVYEANSIFTATDDDLDSLCEERSANVRRKPEKSAIVKLKLKKSFPSQNDIPIPVASLIVTNQLGDTPALDFLSFAPFDSNLTLDEMKERGPIDAVLLAGQTEIVILATCGTEGTIGNINENTALYPGMVGVDTVEFVELMEEGTDREEDEALRERLVEDVQNQEKGGTEKDYEIWAKQVSGVVSARSLPLIRGNGTIDVIVTGANGMPTDELVRKVQEHLQSKAPAGGCSVLTRKPTPIYIDIEAEIKLESGFTFNNSKQHIVKNLDAMIAAENKVNMVRIRKLRQALGSYQGVFNYKLFSPVDDISLDAGELALPGTYTITEAG
jgi:uncharacterized phage protein gp47/JayE